MSNEEVTLAALRDEATEIMRSTDYDLPTRSCWECNSAHEHLKESGHPFLCFACGRFFYKGVSLSDE